MEVFKRFERIMPAHLPRWFFANSGSEVVDNALKIARSFTGRQNIIAFEVGGGLQAEALEGVPGHTSLPEDSCIRCLCTSCSSWQANPASHIAWQRFDWLRWAQESASMGELIQAGSLPVSFKPGAP